MKVFGILFMSEEIMEHETDRYEKGQGAKYRTLKWISSAGGQDTPFKTGGGAQSPGGSSEMRTISSLEESE